MNLRLFHRARDHIRVSDGNGHPHFVDQGVEKNILSTRRIYFYLL